jgi:hypothetical protein
MRSYLPALGGADEWVPATVGHSRLRTRDSCTRESPARMASDSMSENRTRKETLDNGGPIHHFSCGDGRPAAAQRRFSNQQNQWRPGWMRRSLGIGCGPRGTAVV